MGSCLQGFFSMINFHPTSPLCSATRNDFSLSIHKVLLSLIHSILNSSITKARQNIYLSQLLVLFEGGDQLFSPLNFFQGWSKLFLHHRDLVRVDHLFTCKERNHTGGSGTDTTHKPSVSSLGHPWMSHRVGVGEWKQFKINPTIRQAFPENHERTNTSMGIIAL